MFTRPSSKVVLVVLMVVGAIVLSAGIAVAAGVGDRATAVSEEPQGEGSESSGADDDSGEADESDESLGGESARKAAKAALAVAGGGAVRAVESDDDGAGYEVEIRAENGGDVEIELDENFAVVERGDD